MAVFVTSPANLGLLIRTHESQRQKRVTGALRASVSLAAAIVRANAPKASGDLRNSVRVGYSEGGIGEVVVDMPYSTFVEVGCRPHMPPIEPLMRWASIVKPGEDPREVAWKVANKIRLEGIRPTYFVRNSLSRIVEATQARVAYVLEK